MRNKSHSRLSALRDLLVDEREVATAGRAIAVVDGGDERNEREGLSAMRKVSIRFTDQLQGRAHLGDVAEADCTEIEKRDERGEREREKKKSILARAGRAGYWRQKF